MLQCRQENRNGYIMWIIIDGNTPSCRTGVPESLKETVWKAAQAAFPESSPAAYQGRRTCRKVSATFPREASGKLPLLFVSMSGKFPSWLHRCPVRVIRAAVVTSMGFVSSPSGYSWLKRHLMNLSFHILRRHADIYIAADTATKEDIHRYYFIPRDRIGVADDPAALAFFLRSAIGGPLSSAVDKA